MLTTLLSGFLIMRKVACGIDQSEMGKGLRKITHQPARAWFVLLAEQPNVITQRQQTFEQAQCVIATAEHEVGVGEPEATGEKHALARRKTVACGRAVVAQHQAIDHQAALDGLDGRDDAGIARRKEPDGRQQQQAGVEFLRAIGTNECTEAGVETPRAHVGVDTIAHLAPFLNWPRQLEYPRAADRPVESEPRHGLGVREVLAATADFPQTFVRLMPDAGKVQQKFTLNRPALFVSAKPA